MFRGALGTSVFRSYGERTLEGEVPYRDFSLEYPPGSLPAFILPALGPDAGYDHRFMAFEAVCGAALVVLVALALSALGARGVALVVPVGFAALAPLALGPLTLHRYDLWPTALTAGALVAVLVGKNRVAFAALGLGTAAKLFPAVLLPLAFLFVRTHAGARAAWAALATFATALAAVVLPFLVFGPGGVRFSLARQMGRALQLETLGSSLLLGLHELGGFSARVAFDDGSWNLVGRVPDRLAAVQTVLQLAAVVGVWALFARGARDPRQLVLASAAALAVWIALGKVLSPQFLLWLLPLVALVAFVGGPWIPAGFLTALGLTQLVYPARYDELVARESGPIGLLLARNALVVALAAALVIALERERVAQEVPR